MQKPSMIILMMPQHVLTCWESWWQNI